MKPNVMDSQSPISKFSSKGSDSQELETGTIVFEKVTKTYTIMERSTPRLGAWLVNKLFEHLRRTPYDALRDVSFRIEPGEMAGFIGPNGAGKSTVLKLVAGITDPSSGVVRKNGKVASLLELGVGFHPELTGMENIFYNGILMGLSRQQVLERLEEIIEFSGLREFLFEPVKHYSSGMYARLGCSVALHLDPDIVLVDEILSVGDAEFQQRGTLKLLEMSKQGATILLVTHQPALARDMCDRVYWIEKGRLVDSGDPAPIYQQYQRERYRRSIPPGHYAGDDAKAAGGDWSIEEATLTKDGQSAKELEPGEKARITFRLRGTPGKRCYLRILWKWDNGRPLLEEESPVLEIGEDGRLETVYEIERWPLLEARIVLALGLYSDGGELLAMQQNGLEISSVVPFPSIEETLTTPRVSWRLTKKNP